MSEQKNIIVDEDAGLVASWRGGDLASFETLVKKHQKRMFNIAFRISGNYEDACENVQDAFVAAYREIGSFRSEARFTTWLTSIVINLSRNRRQQVKSREQHEAWSMNEADADKSSSAGRELPSPSPSAHDRLERLDLHIKLQNCINALDDEFRETIVLRDLQDSSYEEIGAILKIKEGTVKSRLFRAREMVKDCLKKAVGEL